MANLSKQDFYKLQIAEYRPRPGDRYDFWERQKRDLSSPRFQKVLKLVGQEKNILDIGGSFGFMAKELAKRGNQVTILDFAEILAVSPFASDYIALVAGNAENDLPFTNHTFDLVWAGEIIEHLRNPEHFLKECRRVLSPRGKIILTSKNRHTFRNLWRHWRGRLVITPRQHHHEYTIAELKKIVRQNGFTVTKSTGVGQPWFPHLHVTPRMSNFLWSCFPAALREFVLIRARRVDEKKLN